MGGKFAFSSDTAKLETFEHQGLPRSGALPLYPAGGSTPVIPFALRARHHSSVHLNKRFHYRTPRDSICC